MNAYFDAALVPGMHRFTQMERVIWGRPAQQALSDELEVTGWRRVFIITNQSLGASPDLKKLIDTLGSRYVGHYDRVTAHTPRSCVIDGANAARGMEPDALLAFGGGSVVDATKGMMLCLRHGYTTVAEMDPHANVRTPDVGLRPSDADEWLPLLSIPTTLSGAEFASSAGLTDPEKQIKQAFVHPMQMPRTVILDPAMTLSAPMDLLKSTGMKALDHAIERMTSRTANPYSDAVSELGIRFLADALRRLEGEPNNLDLRSRLQYGMFMSLCGTASGVAVNVSHAIGHVIGAHSHVPHGFTTGVLLPSVLRWMNEEIAPVRPRLSAALDPAGPSDDPATAVDHLVASLGLPGRLRDVGIQQSDFEVIAHKTMHESLLKNSPKPVERSKDVLEILNLAW